MHTDGPRAVGPHGKPVEASAGTTASDVGAMRESASIKWTSLPVRPLTD